MSDVSLIKAIKAVIDAEISRCADDVMGREYKLAIENVWNGIEPILMGDGAIRKDAGTVQDEVVSRMSSPETLNREACGATHRKWNELNPRKDRLTPVGDINACIAAYLEALPSEIPVVDDTTREIIDDVLDKDYQDSCDLREAILKALLPYLRKPNREYRPHPDTSLAIRINNVLHSLNLDRNDIAALPDGATIATNITNHRQIAALLQDIKTYIEDGSAMRESNGHIINEHSCVAMAISKYLEVVGQPSEIPVVDDIAVFDLICAAITSCDTSVDSQANAVLAKLQPYLHEPKRE